jgi:hypothetical protein
MNDQEQFNLDLYRTHVLGRFILVWGAPRSRRVKTTDAYALEVWSFCDSANSVWRFVTLTVRRIAENLHHDANELLVVLDGRSVGLNTEELGFSYVTQLFSALDLSITSVQIPCVLETAMGMPWPPTCTLIDEVRGEKEELMRFQFSTRTIEYVWAIPMYQSESHYMRKAGIEALDLLTANVEMINPYRPPVI